MIAKLYTYGDQLIASPGAHDGFNCPKGTHWWELLAERLNMEPVYVGNVKENTGVSPVYYLSQISEIFNKMEPQDKFVSFVPSCDRSLNWSGSKPQHRVTVDLGMHHEKGFSEWQNRFVFDILCKITHKKNIHIFMDNAYLETQHGTREIKVVSTERQYPELNWMWNWLVQEQGLTTHAPDFFKHYAPDRKLGVTGHEQVFKLLKKYVQ